MSGLVTFFSISLYSTQPENSEVTDEMRKSRNSRCNGSGRSRISEANSGVRLKWSTLLSPSNSSISLSHSARTSETSMRFIASKSVV